MKIYVSGGMSGIPYNNWPLFNEVTALLRAKGYEVFNPAEKDFLEGITPDEFGTPLPEDQYLAIIEADLKELRECDTVVVLPGWEKSRGAKIEVDLAWDLGYPVYTWEDFSRGIYTTVG